MLQPLRDDWNSSLHIHRPLHTHTQKKNRVRVLYIFFVCVCDVAQVLFLCCCIVCQTSLFGVGNKKKAEANWMKWKAEHISLLLLIFFYRPMKKKGLNWIQFIIRDYWATRHRQKVKRNWKKKKKKVSEQTADRPATKNQNRIPFFFFFKLLLFLLFKWRAEMTSSVTIQISRYQIQATSWIILFFFYFFFFYNIRFYERRRLVGL